MIIAVAVVAAAMVSNYREVCVEDHAAKLELLLDMENSGEMDRLSNMERIRVVSEPVYQCEWRWGG